MYMSRISLSAVTHRLFLATTNAPPYYGLAMSQARSSSPSRESCDSEGVNTIVVAFYKWGNWSVARPPPAVYTLAAAWAKSQNQ